MAGGGGGLLESRYMPPCGQGNEPSYPTTPSKYEMNSSEVGMFPASATTNVLEATLGHDTVGDI